MSKTIGESHKGKQCLNCSEPFEWPEFSSYMLRLKSKTVDCVRCQTENYIVPKKGFTYFLTLAVSVILGLIIFLGLQIITAIQTYNPEDDTFAISYLMVFIGAILGMAVIRISLNILNWLTGELSLDRQYKSIADYD